MSRIPIRISKPRKYGNKRSEDGCASKRESKRLGDLKLLEKIGEIRNIQWQVKFELTPKIGDELASYYVADFTYEERICSGRFVPIVEDCKGARTALYILKRKIMRHRYGIEIRET